MLSCSAKAALYSSVRLCHSWHGEGILKMVLADLRFAPVLLPYRSSLLMQHFALQMMLFEALAYQSVLHQLLQFTLVWAL